MSENIVSNAALDLLSETVTDTESGAPPSATPRMQLLLAELDQAASQSATLVSSVDKTPTVLEHRVPKKPKSKSLNPTWSPFSISVIAGILVIGIQILSREAIWSALNLPHLKYWYGYVPRDILEFLARLIGARPILVTGPFVYPVLAIVASFALALAAGLGKRKVEAIFRLAGFAWDRNSFCRGWLITGATGSGKTVSAIVGKFHQVFRNEQGVLRDSWIGSELEAKVEEVEARYRVGTAPIHSRLNKLREQRAKLGVEFEAALQRSLIGEIDFQSLDPQGRVRQAEALKAELETKKTETLETLRSQRLEMVMQLQHLGETSEKLEDLERKIASFKADLEELDRKIVSVQKSDSLMDQDFTSAAAVEYKRLVNKAKAIEEEIGQIEWRELYPIKHQFDATLKKIEQAKYRSFPWGGLCIDEKGLFWQTLLPIARHYNREHHLMLLQTCPDWATAEWKPAARFNLLSDRKIKTSTYAKAIVDTASSVAGGADDKGFFRTQAQTWIEASIDLQWGVRDFQIANGLSEQNSILPSLKRSLDILTSIDAYREWLISESVLQAENSSNKSPAALAVSPTVASAAAQKKLATLVPEDTAFLNALPGRLRKILIDFKRSYWSQPTDQLGGVIGVAN